MWSTDRRCVVAGGVVALLTLGGCFRPMLAETSAAGALRGTIGMPDIDDRFDYHIVGSLEDRLGTSSPGTAIWILDVEPQLDEQRFAVAQDNSVTRITLAATATWELRPSSGGDAVLTGRAFSQSGYSATASLFATRQIQRDVERRLATDIGERVARSILARADTLAR